MNALEVINLARATLAAGTEYPTYVGDTLDTDAHGRLKVPDDPAQFIIHTVSGDPNHEWGSTRYGLVRLQVNAFSVVEGEALAMLALAESLLASERFIPKILVNLARDGPYTGYAQDFERGTSP